MSNRSEPFECHWRPSERLLAAYLASLALAVAALYLAAIPAFWQAAGLLLCLIHALWVLPADSLAAQAHRRLRVRLRFSRGRWVAPQ